MTTANASISSDGRPVAPATPPNVVMIVLDDLGFADLACYGSSIATPHLDAAAENGVRYNSFHVTAECSPTRACLLTGRNHHRVGMGSLCERALGSPGYSGRIPRSAGTLPRLLRDAGYNTFAVGKWHLTPGFERTPAGPFDRWPLGMGFERYYGFLPATTNQWAPDLASDNALIDPPPFPDERYHLTEDLADHAIRFIQDQQQAAPGKPFFCYFAPAAMHAPHQVPREWIERYRGQFDSGWDVYRDETLRRQVESGVVPDGTELTERPHGVQGWDALSSDEQRVYARQMETYAGFLTHTDAQIGRLLDFLTELEALDNTIVIVLSDNGAEAGGGPQGRLGPAAADFESMLDRIDDFGGIRSRGVYSWGWAVAGNTPFKLWKRYSWLGGVRVPLIVRWPAGMGTTSNGEVRSQFCHAIDLMPTVLDAAGVATPATLDGITQSRLDGESILPTLNDRDASSPRTSQYFETRGSRSIYHDGWKATTNHIDIANERERELLDGSHDFDTDRWSLFDLANDFSEAHDVADAHADKLRQLVELWWHEAGRNQVLPLIQGRPASVEPSPYQDRLRYVCRPGGGPVTTPSPFAGFGLTADIEVADGLAASGVICAHHSSAFGFTGTGGWVCYARDGRLVVTFNPATVATRVEVDDVNLTGRHELQITYVAHSDGDGSINITLDGRDVGSADAVPTPAPADRLIEAKLLIGRDQGSPVSGDYQPPFPFTGHVHHLVLDVPHARTTTPDEELEIAQQHD